MRKRTPAYFDGRKPDCHRVEPPDDPRPAVRTTYPGRFSDKDNGHHGGRTLKVASNGLLPASPVSLDADNRYVEVLALRGYLFAQQFSPPVFPHGESAELMPGIGLGERPGPI